MLLNEGIAELLLLLTGGVATAFDGPAGGDNANIGVGDDGNSPGATETGLGNVLAYVSMDVGYPSISSQTITFRATFGAGTGTGTWKEMTVANGVNDAADNLNREVFDVADQEAKGAGEIWRATVAVAFA